MLSTVYWHTLLLLRQGHCAVPLDVSLSRRIMFRGDVRLKRLAVFCRRKVREVEMKSMKPIAIAVGIFLMTLPMPAIAQDAFAAYKTGDYATAYKGFQSLAAQGNANAMNNLGMMLMSGQGIQKDAAAAAQWFKKAAEKGQLDAITNLGTLYELGQGVPQDYARAAELYRAAADYGIGNAQYNLAQLFEAGKGVPKDQAQAYVWYSLAAKAGDQDAAAAKAKLEPTLDKTLHGQAEAFIRNWKPRQG
jgi:TPR repeat protein